MKAPAILCLYISIPLLIFSLFFTIFFPWAVRRFQKLWYPVDNNNVKLPKSNFTMLSEELPAVSNALSINPGRLADIRVIERRRASSHCHSGSKLASPARSSPGPPQAQQKQASFQVENQVIECSGKATSRCRRQGVKGGSWVDSISLRLLSFSWGGA
jgi:hypothetical protein